MEALLHVLLAKLFRKPVPSERTAAYHFYLNRADVREKISAARRARGRKHILGPKGNHFDLNELFSELNVRYFQGTVSPPRLGWSRAGSSALLGHYDATLHAIVLSSWLDRPEVPRLAVEYVLFHEILHIVHPSFHTGSRRCVHTKAFREAERQFPRYTEARAALERLSCS